VRTSDELEPLLRQYRPVGPQPELRARIVGAADGAGARGFRRALVEWLPAAAALLIVVLCQWLASHDRQLLEARLPAIPPIEQAALDVTEPPQ
jgi:hypothetical protein